MPASGPDQMQAFLAMMASERGAADNTVQAYRRDIGDFLQFLDGRGRTPATTEPADISAYLRAMSEAGLAPTSGRKWVLSQWIRNRPVPLKRR